MTDNAKLVYTDDWKVAVGHLLARHGGDAEKAVRSLFTKPCSYEQAREFSVLCAEPMGISEAAFMKIYKRWSRGT